MPQKWECTCGTRNPINHSYCGSCGKRWDRVYKNGDTKTKPRKPDKGDEDRQTGFQVPAVGYTFAASSPQQAVQVEKSSSAGTPQKSLRTLLHQRANRIGKVESRIRRLEAALKEVQTTWPAYVQQLQQRVQQEHAKCLAFQNKAKHELQDLRKELPELMTQQLVPVSQQYVDTPQVSVPFPQHVPQDTHVPTMPQDSTLQHMYTTMMEVDTTPGIQLPSFVLPNITESQQPAPGLPHPSSVEGLNHAHVHVQSHVPASGVHPSIGSSQQSSMFPPCSAETLQQVMNTLAAQASLSNSTPGHAIPTAQGLDSMDATIEPPPGDWNSPPSPAQPVLPIVQDGSAHFPNPLYRKPTDLLPESTSQPVLSSSMAGPVVPVPTSDHVQKAVQEAAEALQQLPPEQGGTGGQGLTPQQLQQLETFAQQQQTCQQQLESLQHMIAKPPKHVNKVQLQPFGHAAQTSPPRVTQIDSMSVHSSPGRHLNGNVGVHNASPPGQRQQKIAKSTPGDVHIQHPQVHGIATPIPASPAVSSRSRSRPGSPTPLPTEVATDAEGEGNLDGLG